MGLKGVYERGSGGGGLSNEEISLVLGQAMFFVFVLPQYAI